MLFLGYIRCLEGWFPASKSWVGLLCVEYQTWAEPVLLSNLKEAIYCWDFSKIFQEEKRSYIAVANIYQWYVYFWVKGQWNNVDLKYFPRYFKRKKGAILLLQTSISGMYISQLKANKIMLSWSIFRDISRGKKELYCCCKQLSVVCIFLS